MKVFERKEGSEYHLVPVPLWAWIALSIGFFILLTVLFWVFFAKIPITVSGRGIMMANVGLFTIQSTATGTVLQIMVRPGDVIKKGDLLLRLYDPQLDLKYREAQSRVKVLENQLKDLKIEIEQEEKAVKNALKTKSEAMRFHILQLQEEIDIATKELQTRQQLVDQGLISQGKYNEGLQKITQKNIEMQNKIGDLAYLYSELKKEYRANEIRVKEQQLASEIEGEKILQVMIDQGKIISVRDGKVLEVLVNIGDLVQQGKPIIWLEGLPTNQNKQKKFVVFGFFPVELGKRIQQGTPILMTLSNVNYNRYGGISGIVKDVSLYAVSYAHLISRFHNKSLIDYLTNQASAVIQVLIEPQTDPENPELFYWTSGEQPPVHITSGTVGNLEATIEKVSPIYYLIPLPTFKS